MQYAWIKAFSLGPLFHAKRQIAYQRLLYFIISCQIATFHSRRAYFHAINYKTQPFGQGDVKNSNIS